MPQKNEVEIVAVATTGDLAPLFDVNSDLLRFKYTSVGSQLFIDGVVMSLGIEVLFKDLADPVKNGIYSVTRIVQSGADYTYTFTRTYQSLLTLRRSAMVFVSSGTVNAQSFWVLNVAEDWTMEVDATFFSNVVTPPANPPTALYVDNINGNDGNNGLTPATALLTFDTAFIRQKNVPNSEIILIASPTDYIMTASVMENGDTIAVDDRMTVNGDSLDEVTSFSTTGATVTSAVVDTYSSTTLITLDAAVLVASAHVGQIYMDSAGAYFPIIANTTTTITVAGDDNGVVGVWAVVIPGATLEFDTAVTDVYLTNLMALNQLTITGNNFHVPNNGVLQTNTTIFNPDLIVDETGVTNLVRSSILSPSFVIDDKADINAFDCYIAIGLIITGVTRIVMHGCYVVGAVIASGAIIEFSRNTIANYLQLINCLLTTDQLNITNPTNSSITCESCQVYINDVTEFAPTAAGLAVPIAIFDNTQIFLNNSLTLTGNKSAGLVGAFVIRGGSQLSIGSSGSLIMVDSNYDYGLDINNNGTVTNNGTITFSLAHLVAPIHVAVNSEFSNNGTVTISLPSPQSFDLLDNSIAEINAALTAPADTTAFASLLRGCKILINGTLTLPGGAVDSFLLNDDCTLTINAAVNVSATNVNSCVNLTASDLSMNTAAAVVTYVGGSSYDIVADNRSSVSISNSAAFNSTTTGALVSGIRLLSSNLNIQDSGSYVLAGGSPFAIENNYDSSILVGTGASVTAGAAMTTAGINLLGTSKLVIVSAASLTNIFGPGGAGVDELYVWSAGPGAAALPAAGTSYIDAAAPGDLSTVFVQGA